MNWRSVTDAVPYAIYLTYHEDDLYPVCGFMHDDGKWTRITKGPEDDIFQNTGNYTALLRSPTHIIDLEDLLLHAQWTMTLFGISPRSKNKG